MGDRYHLDPDLSADLARKLSNELNMINYPCAARMTVDQSGEAMILKTTVARMVKMIQDSDDSEFRTVESGLDQFGDAERN